MGLLRGDELSEIVSVSHTVSHSAAGPSPPPAESPTLMLGLHHRRPPLLRPRAWPLRRSSSLHSVASHHRLHGSRSPLAVSPPLLPLELTTRSSVCLCRGRSIATPLSPASHPPRRCSHQHPLLPSTSPSPLQHSGAVREAPTRCGHVRQWQGHLHHARHHQPLWHARARSSGRRGLMPQDWPGRCYTTMRS